MPQYAFTLPYAVDSKSAHVILGQRQLIQHRVNGTLVKGIIPEWAGQWGLIGGPSAQNETPECTAIRTFREQTGLDLQDHDVCANFILGNRSTVNMKTPNYDEFCVACIFTTKAALDLLASVISDVVGTSQCREGILAGASVLSMAEARKKIGPTPSPSGGWKKFLVQSYYEGKPPGQLNTEVDTLTKQITTKTAQDHGYFTTALSDKQSGV